MDNQLKKCVLLLLAVIFWVLYKFKKRLVSGCFNELKMWRRKEQSGRAVFFPLVCLCHVYASFIFSIYVCFIFVFLLPNVCLHLHKYADASGVTLQTLCCLFSMFILRAEKKTTVFSSLEISVFKPEEKISNLREEKAGNILAFTFCLR